MVLVGKVIKCLEKVQYSVNRCSFPMQRGRDDRILPDFFAQEEVKPHVYSFDVCVFIAL